MLMRGGLEVVLPLLKFRRPPLRARALNLRLDSSLGGGNIICEWGMCRVPAASTVVLVVSLE